MKINHTVIRGILKWGTLVIFVISVGFKLKTIFKYGGTISNTDPNKNIRTVEDGPILSCEGDACEGDACEGDACEDAYECEPKECES